MNVGVRQGGRGRGRGGRGSEGVARGPWGSTPCSIRKAARKLQHRIRLCMLCMNHKCNLNAPAWTDNLNRPLACYS